MDGFVGNVLKVTDHLVKVLSFEFLLTEKKRPNGGDIVLLRALLAALVVYLASIAVKQALDPSHIGKLDWREMATEISASIPVFGAIFAAIYFALYTRFSAQWTYLANLYNQIKQAEVRTANLPEAKPTIAQWKAGFIEDADDLHLATKRIFAPVIVAWVADPTVEKNFIDHTPGGKRRLDALMLRVEAAYALIEKKYSSDGSGTNA